MGIEMTEKAVREIKSIVEQQEFHSDLLITIQVGSLSFIVRFMHHSRNLIKLSGVAIDTRIISRVWYLGVYAWTSWRGCN